MSSPHPRRLRESAPRIAYILQAAWAVGVLAIVVSQDAALSAEYVVRWPGTQPVMSLGQALCSDEDARQWKDALTLGGRKVSIALCFKACTSAGGARVIPYKVEADGRWWGEQKGGEHVRAYAEQVALDFVIPMSDERTFAVRWWPARWRQVKRGLAWFLAGSAVLWLAYAVVRSSAAGRGGSETVTTR